MVPAGTFFTPPPPIDEVTQTLGYVDTSEDAAQWQDDVTRGVDRVSGLTGESNEQMVGGWDEGEQLSTDSPATTELICPNWAASPEELQQLKVTTLAVIGMIGVVIVAYMLLCMLYKNERLMENMPKFERKKKKSPPGMNLALLVNSTLHTIPAIRLSPGIDIPSLGGGGHGTASPGGAAGAMPAGFGGLAQKPGKHFPTPKNMLVDVCPVLPSGGQTPPLLLVCSGEVLPQGVMAMTHAPQPLDTLGIVAGGDAALASRFPEKPSDYQKQRATYNDSDMRRHHPGAMAGSLYGCATGQNNSVQSHHLTPARCPDEESQSGCSWYSDDTTASLGSEEEYDDERRDSSIAFWEDDDDFHAESRRGARGERTRHSIKSRDRFSDKYGNSMSSRKGPIVSQDQSSQSVTPHEVSYMSGRFW